VYVSTFCLANSCVVCRPTANSIQMGGPP
jgi:hypothetical protein